MRECTCFHLKLAICERLATFVAFISALILHSYMYTILDFYILFGFGIAM